MAGVLLRATQEALGHKSVTIVRYVFPPRARFSFERGQQARSQPPVVASEEPTDTTTDTGAFSLEETQTAHMH